MSDQYSYFDEMYFQEGKKKGTAYYNYIEASRTSVHYEELAKRIVDIFRPRNCLEIGCATGIVVKRINDWGVEAHGIDVSEWAVARREHPNVSLAGAEGLPFPDNSFDLVFSCHSLEHIPLEKKDAAFAEMTRVCSDGVQFHMLPIIGLGPYAGDPDFIVEGLRADPTHNLLFDKDWWIEQWGRFGWNDTGLKIAFAYDTPSFELTDSQYVLARKVVPDHIRERIQENNVGVARALHHKVTSAAKLLADRSLPNIQSPGFAFVEGQEIVYDDRPIMRGNEGLFDFAPVDLTQGPTSVVIVLEGEPPTCRIVVGSGIDDAWSDCAEHYFSLRQGINSFVLEPSDFRIIRGNPDFQIIRKVQIGGIGSGSAAVLRFWCALPWKAIS